MCVVDELAKSPCFNLDLTIQPQGDQENLNN